MKFTHFPLLILVLVYLIFGIGFALQTSTFNAPDERGHFLYLEYIHETGLLPVLSADSPNKEAHQPPLYYWISQPVFALTDAWPERSQVLALRFWSLLLSTGVILLAYASVRRLFPEHKVLALLVTAFVALNPQFIFMSSVINNDALTNLLGAAWVFSTAWLMTAEEKARMQKRSNILMVLLALGMFLTKSSLWPLVVLLAFVHVFRAPSAQRGRIILYWAAGAILILWWLMRNVLLYGDPTVRAVQHELWYAEQHRDFLTSSGVWNWLVTLAESFWARFAYFNIALPGIFYLFAKLGMLFGAIGFLRYLSFHWHERYQPRMLAISTWVLGALSIFIGVFWYSLSFYQPQGRYLFAVLPVLAFVLTLGILSLTPRRFHWVVIALVVAGLVLADVKSYELLSKYA